jgi:RNA-directed DNA polymerase
VLEADIQGFFDNLNHQWILEHIPMDPHVLKEWLKAGIFEKGNLVDSESGVPQGGPISPIIANMCLDG